MADAVVDNTALRPDFLIIGGGIIGLAIAREIRQRQPSACITLIEKEPSLAAHGSGRNSGVLHAGFYYTADSLKARFCRDGNRAMRDYCMEHGLAINPCGKLVVATSDAELVQLDELKRRGDANAVQLDVVDEQQMAEIEPNAQSHGRALFSPNTATVSSPEVCAHIAAQLLDAGVHILTGQAYVKRLAANCIQTTLHQIDAGIIINAAGLYADRIAKQFSFSDRYCIMPFKGIYLKQSSGAPALRTNIYPVPDLAQPFLGVHFTVTSAGAVKIGPTAIPAFWREHYQGVQNFSSKELLEIVGQQAELFINNRFGFRGLAFQEMRKYQRSHFIQLASKLVKNLEPDHFKQWARPGIRAQLLDIHKRELVKDFVVEGDGRSIHVLNAVSPAFTCSFPFAAWVYDRYIDPQ